MMHYESFTARPLVQALGAQIEGIQLADVQSPAAVAELRDALNRFEVVFFRDQDLTPMQQVSLAEKLGPIVKPVVEVHKAPAPGITVLDLSDPKGVSDEWHSDQSYTERPPIASMLHAIMIPSVGGDTIWASMTSAYDDLSAPMKAFVAGLSVTHSTDRLIPRMQATARKHNMELAMKPAAAVHPLVRTHAETGRKILYVNPLYAARINELNAAESASTLEFLFEHVKSPQFQVRFQWRERSVALWDQRSTIHYAVADYSERRIMHRVMIDGNW